MRAFLHELELGVHVALLGHRLLDDAGQLAQVLPCHLILLEDCLVRCLVTILRLHYYIPHLS